MTFPHRTISLGFANQRFAPGIHICQIYSEDDEREEAILKFLLTGLQAGERTSCFSGKLTEDFIAEFLEKNGITSRKARESGAFSFKGVQESYFKDGCFDPDRMLGLLGKYHQESAELGFAGARVIGEMAPEVLHLPGGSRLLEYESRVSLLLRDHPVTSVCQYDARSFDGAMIMDILKVHPFMVVRGSVIHNPFFIEPEVFLSCRDK